VLSRVNSLSNKSSDVRRSFCNRLKKCLEVNGNNINKLFINVMSS